MRSSFLRGFGTLTQNRFGRYDLLLPSSAMKRYPNPLPVPESIPRPGYVPKNFFSDPWGGNESLDSPPMLEHDGERIAMGTKDETAVRAVGKMAAEILKAVKGLIKPGVTTAEIDQAVHDMIVSRGAYPSTLGYSKYPKSCTVAVNNVLAHGIPDDRPLDPTDLINVDLTVFYGGFHGDTSSIFLLPEVDDQGKELVNVTQEALMQAIKVCGPGVPLNEIGRVIEEKAGKHGMSVNTQLTGHGIGKRFQQPPFIVHHENHDTTPMQLGDCFTIEPILVQGRESRGFVWDDGWTMSSESGARSAQFEHQVLITDNGAEVLTVAP